MNCKICTSDNTEIKRVIKISEVSDHYKSEYGIEVDLPSFGDIKQIHCKSCTFSFFTPDWIGDGKYYEILEKFDWYYSRDKHEFDYCLKVIKQHNINSILEIGAADGNFAVKVPSYISYIGLELNEEAALKAQSRGCNIKTTALEGIKDASVDLVCAFQVLEHVPEPSQFIDDCLRKLLPGGYLLFSVPNDESFLNLQKLNVWNMPPHHQSLWNRNVIQEIARKLNLQIISYDIEPLRKEHYKPFALAHCNQLIHASKLNFGKNWLRKFLAGLIYIYPMLFSKFITGHTLTFVLRKS